MTRTTLSDASRRVQTHSSRGTLRQSADDHYWPEVDIDMMKSETHTGVEMAFNYGFSCYPCKQDQSQQQQSQQRQQGSNGGNGQGGEGGGPGEQGQQPEGDAAEVIVNYLNGSRSHGVVTVVGDRRHRVNSKNVKAAEGDVFLHRKKDDYTQVHLHESGLLMSAPEGRTARMALVTPPQQRQQQGQQGQQNKKGQQPLHQENSKAKKFVDVTDDRSRVQGTNALLMLAKDDMGYVHVSEDQKVWLGYEQGKAKFAKVLTEDGISDNVHARLGAGPLPNMGGGGGGGSYASAGGLEEGATPPKRVFWAKTSELDAVVARLDALEARLTALEKNHPVLFWLLKKAL